jgi:hypothetical protein
VPPLPFRYTPVVWGHIGAGGVSLSARPLKIGCEVRMDTPVTGELVARGLGNSLGEVNIMPHYSHSRNQAATITAENRRALVQEGETLTIYVNLWNEGLLGTYDFDPKNAQLFVLALPLYRGVAIEPFAIEGVRA